MRSNGSMMLMQALQNARPRIPQVASEPEPQASIYATKAADEGALDAWRNVTGLHNAQAERGSREGMSQATLANALERARMQQQEGVLRAALGERTKLAELQQGDEQFRAGMDWKKQRAPQEDALKREEMQARIRAARASHPPRQAAAPADKSMDPEKQFDAADQRINALIANAMRPETWNNVNPREAQVQRQALIDQLLEKQKGVREARARFSRARFNGDRAAMDRELQMLSGAQPVTPQEDPGIPSMLRRPGAGDVEEFTLPDDAEQEAMQRAAARAAQGG